MQSNLQVSKMKRSPGISSEVKFNGISRDPGSNLQGVAYRFETPGAQHRLFLPTRMRLERSDNGCSWGLNLGLRIGSLLTSLLTYFCRRLQAAPGVAVDLLFPMFWTLGEPAFGLASRNDLKPLSSRNNRFRAADTMWLAELPLVYSP